MARPKTKRRARYWYLRDRHFAPIEAREFSRLRRKYPALKKMLKQRTGMWRAHEHLAISRGWSDYKTHKEWVEKLKLFYAQERYKVKTDRETGLSIPVLTNWIVRKDVHGRFVKPRPSVWEWYDAVFSKLPAELKWDTPRSHRVRDQGEVKLKKVTAQKWIADLNKSISRTSDPAAKARFRDQIANLKRGLRGT